MRRGDAHGADGPVAAVRESAVEADRDAETRDRVGAGGQDVGGLPGRTRAGGNVLPTVRHSPR